MKVTYTLKRGFLQLITPDGDFTIQELKDKKYCLTFWDWKAIKDDVKNHLMNKLITPEVASTINSNVQHLYAASFKDGYYRVPKIERKGLVVTISIVVDDNPIKAKTKTIFFEDVEEGKKFAKEHVTISKMLVDIA